ncbi:DUF6194 family protein [Micromonospora sp. DSM 115977]|uniref:DUF6194 family protein n=1 Tax=Micromonospora reichwaldensis TaxID=3075516 RepID=A0ABU2X002_9ACTN|nr:DUF6194 family protein [Micromonospora sp. DSM 115977]MDT0531456.1 DUF6194 family protein [Micromonospora sp. DSM 115977]
MDVGDMKRYIRETFDGVNALEANGDTFYIYDPGRDLPAERQLPFATIVTGDHYDDASDLGRPGAWRLNVGLTRSAYGALFAQGHGPDVDHTVPDTVLPHPIYARQHWVCVVNPGAASVDAVRQLLAEAYDFAARKHANHRSRRGSS